MHDQWWIKCSNTSSPRPLGENDVQDGACWPCGLTRVTADPGCEHMLEEPNSEGLSRCHRLRAFVLGGLGTWYLTWPWCMMTVSGHRQPDLAQLDRFNFFPLEQVFSYRAAGLVWTVEAKASCSVDHMHLFAFSVAVKMTDGHEMGDGQLQPQENIQYGKNWPLSPDGYCNIIYHETLFIIIYHGTLRATFLFNCNRISLSTLLTWWNILQLLTSILA